MINHRPTIGACRDRRRDKTLRARRGFVLSIELALVLPILLLVLLALLEFSLLLFARSAVVEASRVGARKASLPGVTLAAIEHDVRRVLPPRLKAGLVVEVAGGGKTGDVVTVAVSVPMRSAAPDVLWIVGFSLRNRTLLAETSMIQE